MSSGMNARYSTFTKSRTLSSFRSPSSGQHDIMLSSQPQPFVAKSSSYSYSYAYPYKWDDAQKWISSPMGNNVKPPGSNHRPSPRRTLSHRSRNTASLVVREVVFEELSLNNYRLEKRKSSDPGPGAVTSVSGNKLLTSSNSSKPLESSTISDCRLASPPTFSKDTGTEMTPSRTRSPVKKKPTDLHMIPIAAMPAPSESKESVILLGMKLRKAKPVADIILEDVEISKYMERFKREEARIQAWEDGLKEEAKIELIKLEAKLERMRSQAHSEVRSKLEAVKKKAEKKHAVAEGEWERQAERVARKAEYIRTTGRIPSRCTCFWRM